MNLGGSRCFGTEGRTDIPIAVWMDSVVLKFVHYEYSGDSSWIVLIYSFHIFPSSLLSNCPHSIPQDVYFCIKILSYFFLFLFILRFYLIFVSLPFILGTVGNSEPHLLRALSCHFLLKGTSGNAGKIHSDPSSDTVASELTHSWTEQSLDGPGKLRISIWGVSLNLN